MKVEGLGRKPLYPSLSSTNVGELMASSILCPFHRVELVRAGGLWVCPIEECIYMRLACPVCGFVIRIAPPKPFCLGCGSEFSLDEVISLCSSVLGLSRSEAERLVLDIYSRYLPVSI